MAYENDTYGGEVSSGQLMGEVARDIAVAQFSYTSLENLSKGWRQGYHLPGTRTSMGKKWFGKRGVVLVKPIMPAGLRKLYQRGGVMGFTGARKAAIAAYGREAASWAGAKFLVSKVAGLAVGATWAQLGGYLAVTGVKGYQAISNAVTRYRGLEMGGYFQDTPGAYSSRQRALQAITASQLQARSAIGNEAMLFHR